MGQPALLLILLAIFGIAGTLTGVWLGSRLTRSNEERKWRRDHCLEAYADVIQACNIVAFEADAAYGMQYATEDGVKQSGIVLEKVAEMYRAADKVSLLGSYEIRQPLGELVSFYGNEIAAKSIERTNPSQVEWRKIRSEGIRRYTNFLNEARNELGVHPPLHTIDEWSRIANRTKN